MPDIREKLQESKALFDQARAILMDKEAPADKKAAVQQMIADATALKREADDLKAILDSGIDQALADAQASQGPDQQKRGGPGAAAGPVWGGSWGEWLSEVWKAGHPGIKSAPDPRLTFFEDEAFGPNASKERKDMVENVGASGGYLVPTEFQSALQAALVDNSIVRQRATVIPMRRRQLDMPVLDQTGTTAGQPHWFGGLRFYWEEEAAQKTESDPLFRKISLVAHKLIGYTRASDELLDDSAISLDAFLRGPMGFAGGAAWMEDYAFLRGNGAGQPLGVINAGATITVERATVGTVGFADIADMMERFLPGSRGVWIASQSLLSELVQMTGPTGNQAYIWLGAAAGLTVPSAIGPVPGMLMGLPLIWSEKSPLRGYDGDLLLADFRYYLVGDRQATTVESTKFDRWQYDQTSWRLVHRVDGQPWLSASLVYADGVTSVSPFVVLGGSAIT